MRKERPSQKEPLIVPQPSALLDASDETDRSTKEVTSGEKKKLMPFQSLKKETPFANPTELGVKTNGMRVMTKRAQKINYPVGMFVQDGTTLLASCSPSPTGYQENPSHDKTFAFVVV